MRLIADPKDGVEIDCTSGMYPSRLRVVQGNTFTANVPTSTTFGYVVAGAAEISGGGLSVTASEGCFFGIPGELKIRADGTVMTIERIGFRGLPLFGRIEATGRLAYIDGCSDSILCMPPRLGDPVLNHLHFPHAITQTLHSHPSIRLGVIARGRGLAYGPLPKGGTWELQLKQGGVFLLEPHETHAFKTPDDGSMDVIAYHPDSDWGPTDGVHPMLNRTYIQRH